MSSESSISILPSNTIHLIKSTQVITSVYSIVKELTENALDAEATMLIVRLEGHGLKRVEVRDNGCGISETDLQLVCLPHTTSKITCFSDLDNLCSYGFRGEALSSLCQVSSVSISSKCRGANLGYTCSYHSNGSVSSSKVAVSTAGSSITVTDLFTQLPVRRQYHSDARRRKEQLKKIEDLLMAYSLVRPKLHITFTNDKSVVFQKSPAEDTYQALHTVFPDFAGSLIHKSITRDQVELSVYLPRMTPGNSDNKTSSRKASSKNNDSRFPPYSRSSNDRLFVLVNSRPVHLKQIEKVIKGYFSLTSEGCHGRYPAGLVTLQLPPADLDVNLEPNKDKVMFCKQDLVLDMLNRVLTEIYGALGAKDNNDSDIIPCTLAQATQPHQTVTSTSPNPTFTENSSTNDLETLTYSSGNGHTAGSLEVNANSTQASHEISEVNGRLSNGNTKSVVTPNKTGVSNRNLSKSSSKGNVLSSMKQSTGVKRSLNLSDDDDIFSNHRNNENSYSIISADGNDSASSGDESAVSANNASDGNKVKSAAAVRLQKRFGCNKENKGGRDCVADASPSKTLAPSTVNSEIIEVVQPNLTLEHSLTTETHRSLSDNVQNFNRSMHGNGSNRNNVEAQDIGKASHVISSTPEVSQISNSLDCNSVPGFGSFSSIDILTNEERRELELILSQSSSEDAFLPRNKQPELSNSTPNHCNNDILSQNDESIPAILVTDNAPTTRNDEPIPEMLVTDNAPTTRNDEPIPEILVTDSASQIQTNINDQPIPAVSDVGATDAAVDRHERTDQDNINGDDFDVRGALEPSLLLKGPVDPAAWSKGHVLAEDGTNIQSIEVVTATSGNVRSLNSYNDSNNLESSAKRRKTEHNTKLTVASAAMYNFDKTAADLDSDLDIICHEHNLIPKSIDTDTTGSGVSNSYKRNPNNINIDELSTSTAKDDDDSRDYFTKANNNIAPNAPRTPSNNRNGTSFAPKLIPNSPASNAVAPIPAPESCNSDDITIISTPKSTTSDNIASMFTPKSCNTAAAQKAPQLSSSTKTKKIESSSDRKARRAVLSSPGAERQQCGSLVRKPVSAFASFAKDIRNKVMSEFPGAEFTVIGREIASRWKVLPPTTRDHYEQNAKLDTARYHNQIKQARESRGAGSPAAASLNSSMDRYMCHSAADVAVVKKEPGSCSRPARGAGAAAVVAPASKPRLERSVTVSTTIRDIRNSMDRATQRPRNVGCNKQNLKIIGKIYYTTTDTTNSVQNTKENGNALTTTSSNADTLKNNQNCINIDTNIPNGINDLVTGIPSDVNNRDYSISSTIEDKGTEDSVDMGRTSLRNTTYNGVLCFACEEEDRLYGIRTHALLELLLCCRLLETLAVPTQLLLDPVPFNASTVGVENWSALLKLSRAPSEKSVFHLVTDERMCSNGLTVALYADATDTSRFTHGELQEVAANVGFYGLTDLKEILAVLCARPNAPLIMTRPVKLRHWIKGECLRLARNSPSITSGQELKEKLKLWRQYKEKYVSKPHNSSRNKINTSTDSCNSSKNNISANTDQHNSSVNSLSSNSKCMTNTAQALPHCPTSGVNNNKDNSLTNSDSVITTRSVDDCHSVIPGLPNLSVCLHGKKILHEFYDLDNLPGSQHSQSLAGG